jgi:DNA polymerase I
VRNISVEDRVIAIETNCKAKLKIFTDNVDAHCLNAYSYFKEEFANRGIFIDTENAVEVNSLKDLANDLRQKGKTVTFKR